MTYQLLLLLILLFSGILGEVFYQYFCKKEEVWYKSAFRVTSVSLLTYMLRGFIAIVQGHGADHMFIYFETLDSSVKYILFSIPFSFLLINSYIYLEQTILPLWKEKQTKTEDTTHE